MTLVEELYSSLGLEPGHALQIISARELMEPIRSGMSPAYLLNPGSSVLVTSGVPEEELRQALGQVYPDGHRIQKTAVGLLLDPLSPLEDGSYLNAIQYVTERLRAPDGCPWDRAQDHHTIKNNLIEECYEAVEALDAGDPAKMAEELGDLLLQVTLHAEIARQQGEFDLRDVVRGITSKLVRRHPHVFAGVKADTAEQVLTNWDEIKKKERGEELSILSGVAAAMPALAYAQEVSKRAARQGFEWADIDGVVGKVQEEVEELLQAPGAEEQMDEFGDLLFTLVQVARWKGFEAEEALRAANRKFRQRFEEMERIARERGLHMKELDLASFEALWSEAKSRVSVQARPI